MRTILPSRPAVPRTTVLLVVGLAALSACLLDCGCQKSSKPSAAAVQSIRTQGGVEMVLIPPADFLMGSDHGEPDEKPAHRVYVGSFCMDKFEVTQKAYQALMGTNPSRFKDPNRPVERISWAAAVKYCNMRSLKEGLHPCYDLETMSCDFQADGYRLPTEAEWEYACRAGTTTDYSFGNDPALLSSFACFRDNSGQTTDLVGRRRANAWGLFDMHGNVSEWTSDFYSETAYRSSSADDPRGPASGEKRVLRGGSWRSAPDQCRSSARLGETPGFADVCFGYEAYGLRCVKKATPASMP